MIRQPPRSTHCISSAASDVYKRQSQQSSNIDLEEDTDYTIIIFFDKLSVKKSLFDQNSIVELPLSKIEKFAYKSEQNEFRIQITEDPLIGKTLSFCFQNILQSTKFYKILCLLTDKTEQDIRDEKQDGLNLRKSEQSQKKEGTTKQQIDSYSQLKEQNNIQNENTAQMSFSNQELDQTCLLYTSPSPRDQA
eukprot:TRINITY_DN33244_c0_g1_i1.p2 TRINITY_DN33244_c0_g1~~TRINITY_DN33244_c0_g1_i1.p2  ORF type:complete len:192 (-),score=42.46 TRINITY_DN33244_c0_g1_i1:122-697(-)